MKPSAGGRKVRGEAAVCGGELVQSLSGRQNKVRAGETGPDIILSD